MRTSVEMIPPNGPRPGGFRSPAVPWVVFVASLVALIAAPTWLPSQESAGVLDVRFIPDAEQRLREQIEELRPVGNSFGMELERTETLVDSMRVTFATASRGTPQMILRPAAHGRRGERTGRSLTFYLVTPYEDVRRALDEVAVALAARDDGSLVRSVDLRPVPLVALAYAWLGLGPLLATLALFVRDGWSFPSARDTFIKRTHVLPVVLQLLFFAYWALYWPAVTWHVPSIVAQMLFAYVLDVLAAWWLRRSWPGLLAMGAPVLSANLFVCFTGTDLWMSFLVIAAAVGSKALIRRDGRHVFNPSAFGTSVAACLVLAFPSVFHHTDIAAAISSPPNMSEVMFLATLIPLALLDTAPIAIGAAVGMLVLGALLGRGPTFTWPGWFLAVTIFAGDPATAPRTRAGRFLFGLGVGSGIQLTARLLVLSTGIDFWAKVLPIPFFNLASGRLDAVGPTVARRMRETVGALATYAEWPLRRPLLTWCAIFLTVFSLQKSGGFVRAFHRDWGTPLVHTGPGGEIECDANRAFCEPFRFDLEIAGWLRDRTPIVSAVRE